MNEVLLGKILLWGVFAFCLLYILRIPYSLIKYSIADKKHFKDSFEDFNKDRHNPLDEKSYKSIYDFEYHISRAYWGSPFDSNMRDGDELMTNSNRDPIKRITDHFDFNRIKKDTTHMKALGYDFKSKDNLFKFLAMVLKEMPEGTQIFPVNRTWCILSKTSEGCGFSLDKRILTNKEYRYLEMT